MNSHRLYLLNNNIYSYIISTGLDEDLQDRIIEGQKIEIVPEFKFKIGNNGMPLPDFLGTGSMEFFVNSKLKVFLEKHISNEKINFIETSIRKEKYWLLNVLNVVDAIDTKKSHIINFKNGNIDKIPSLVLIEKHIEDKDIFKLKNFEIPIFVSDKLMNLLLEKQFTGMTFFSDPNLSVLE